MTIILVLSSILIVTFSARAVSRLSSWNICPVCVGVSLTWIVMFIGMSFFWLPVTEFQLPTAILMGGSIVGIAYKLEGNLRSGRSQLVWKTLFMTTGFGLSYELVSFDWPSALFALVVLAVILYLFIDMTKSNRLQSRSLLHGSGEKVEKLVEEMKKGCC
ncbi:MAG: hypothetical protein HZA94_00980 [Candidatus Vogelbacteria bacterium]|nr:hypothetical protein [Candidatus Vogelbacteria bacterium]